MSVRKSASSSGLAVSRQQPKRHRATTARRKPSCVHHWILENTKYPIIEGSGQTNIGNTKGRCKKCDKTKRTTAATPDSVHGLESLIASNLRLEEGELPEGFHGLEGEDYDA